MERLRGTDMSLVERGEFDRVLAFHRGRVNQHERTVLTKSPVQDSGIDLARGRARGVTGYEMERQRLVKQRVLMAEKAKELEDHIRRLGGVQATELAYGPDERPTIRGIQWHVCEYSKTTRVDLLSTRRTAAIVKVRHIGMMLSKMMTVASLPEIGRKFGGRDHTTVLHAIRKTEKLQKLILERVSPCDEISLWVSTAFEGWDETMGKPA